MRSFFALGVLLIGFTLGLTAQAKQAANKPCPLKQYATITLIPGPGGIPLIPVTLNGKQALMSLHTEVALSALYADSAEEFGVTLKAWPASYIDVRLGEEKVKRIASAQSVALGMAGFGKTEFLVDEYHNTLRSPILPPLVGILGTHFFYNVDVELDLGHNKLNLFSPEHCKGNVVYWSDKAASVPTRNGGFDDMYISMDLDGKKLQTVLSTGSPDSVLGTDVSKKFYGFDENSENVVTESSPDGQSVSHYRAMALSTQGLQALNTKVWLVKRNADDCGLVKRADDDGAVGYNKCAGAYPLRLGMNVLSKLRIYIATKEKMMYFTSADAKFETATAEGAPSN